MVTAAIALIIASYGLTWPAIALFLAALAAENISNILAHVTRRPERFSWRAYICPALALLGLAVLGSHWRVNRIADQFRSEEHTSEIQSLMRITYAVFCLQKKINTKQ